MTTGEDTGPTPIDATDTGTARAGALRSLGRGAVLFALAVRDALVALWLTVVLCLVAVLVGIPLIRPALLLVRSDAQQHRRLAAAYSGLHARAGYRFYAREGSGVVAGVKHALALLSDPMTRRDLLWHLVNPFVGGALGLIPLALVVHGVWGILLPVLWGPVTSTFENSWYWFLPLRSQGLAMGAALLGILEIVVALRVAGPLVDLHARWVRVVLCPPSVTELRERVDHLSETRQDAVEMQAAELRRIERDLHDGAQARLVAMGMALGAAEQILERDPEGARTILREAKGSSSLALTEIRDLVRGIHPPVLADRGLSEALRAVAADSPISASVTSTLRTQLIAPLESAVYFAVSECLTNAAKHSRADRVDIRVTESADVVEVTVRDNGFGGATEEPAGGLHGIRRRLAAFDGELAVTSPAGGPTTVRIAVPKVASTGPEAPAGR